MFKIIQSVKGNTKEVNVQGNLGPQNPRFILGQASTHKQSHTSSKGLNQRIKASQWKKKRKEAI